jgi:CRP/FNR family cyclic AMP-dependent transcriptional regulator
VEVLSLEAGPWSPDPTAHGRGVMGAMILGGVLCRTVMIGHEGSDELVGPGDVIYPWARRIDSDVLEAEVSWEVLQPAEVAVLDESFMRSIAPWPELVAALACRYGERSRLQGALAATAHVKRMDIRLLALLWQLAERFGRVTPDGVVVPVRLTHARLARLVGGQRPSVTTALTRMARVGTIKRWSEGGFVLAPESIATLDQLAHPDDRTPT